MNNEALLTEHAIDDASITAPETMLFFLEIFHFPLLLYKVSGDSREARFRIYQHALGNSYRQRAERIIKCLHLPLEVFLDIKEIGGLTYETTLFLKYTGR